MSLCQFYSAATTEEEEEEYEKLCVIKIESLFYIVNENQGKETTAKKYIYDSWMKIS